MNSFLLGFNVVWLLLVINNLIFSIIKYKPDLKQAIPLASLFINTIVIFSYAHIVDQFIVDNTIFVSGMLLAILVSMLIKINKLIKL